MIARRAALVASALAWAVLAAGLHHLRGVLPLPALGDLGALRDVEAWYRTMGPTGSAAALARAVALVTSAWLGVACAAQLVATLPWVRSLQPLADVLSPRSLQRLGHGLAGLSLTAGLAAPAPSAGAHPAQPLPVEEPTATMRQLEPIDAEGSPPATVAPTTTTSPSITTAPAMTTMSPSPTMPTGAPAGVPEATPAVPVPLQPGPSSPPRAVAPPAEGRGDEVVVEPGDSFWSLAEETVAERMGTTDERTVATYWRSLVEANRERLVDRDNPDLLLPGQAVVLPPG